MVVSDDRLTVLGRPWITLAIDVATRCVLGMYISMDAPSSVSVSLCIEHAVLPKPENAKDPGIWPMYGKPRKFLVDNGMEESPAVAEASEGSDEFYLTVSAEEADSFEDTDLFVTYGTEDLLEQVQADPLLAEIPAIADGAVAVLPDSTPLAAAANPTPLSIPWGLEDYLAMLSDAAQNSSTAGR
mgnify:CR=1 FL=1